MLSQGPQPELKGWEALPGLPQEQLQPLSLQPGQPLHDRSHLPPGVLLIQQGQMRLLGVDQRKESFTLQRFGSGDLVGAELLLRGVPGLSLTAASEVEGSLLPAEAFFQLLQQQPELLNSFTQLLPWELFAVTASRNDPRHPTAQELLQWAQDACELSENSVHLLSSGRSHELPVSSGSWLISTDNIAGETPGTVLQSPCRVEVIGRLPARLLPLPSHWPPQRQVETSPSAALAPRPWRRCAATPVAPGPPSPPPA